MRLALSYTLEVQVYRHHLAVCTLIRCFRIYPPRDAARWQRTLAMPDGNACMERLERCDRSTTVFAQRSQPTGAVAVLSRCPLVLVPALPRLLN